MLRGTPARRRVPDTGFAIPRTGSTAVPGVVSGRQGLYLNVRRFCAMRSLHVRPATGRSLTLFIAERSRHRLLGLAGLPVLPPHYGLLIPGCASVHTFGMRFAIDLLFVAGVPGGFDVIEQRSAVPPRRVVHAAERGLSV